MIVGGCLYWLVVLLSRWSMWSLSVGITQLSCPPSLHRLLFNLRESHDLFLEGQFILDLVILDSLAEPFPLLVIDIIGLNKWPSLDAIEPVLPGFILFNSHVKWHYRVLLNLFLRLLVLHQHLIFSLPEFLGFPLFHLVVFFYRFLAFGISLKGFWLPGFYSLFYLLVLVFENDMPFLKFIDVTVQLVDYLRNLIVWDWLDPISLLSWRLGSWSHFHGRSTTPVPLLYHPLDTFSSHHEFISVELQLLIRNMTFLNML